MQDLSARTLDEVREVPTKRIKVALEALEKNLGGREELAKILAPVSCPTDEAKFIAILGDPEQDGKSLASLLGTFGLSPARFFKLLSEAKAVQAVMASMDSVYRHLPKVAEHTMERAIPREEKCYRCEGTGKYLKAAAKAEQEEVWGICGDCKGKGALQITPELEEVKLALQVGGLMKGGGPTVTVNQQVDARSLTVNSPFSDQRAVFKDFSEASDRVLYGRATAPSADTVGSTKTFVDENPNEIVEAEEVAPEKKVEE